MDVVPGDFAGNSMLFLNSYTGLGQLPDPESARVALSRLPVLPSAANLVYRESSYLHHPNGSRAFWLRWHETDVTCHACGAPTALETVRTTHC